MEGLIEGVLAGGWPFVVGWVLPAGVFVSLFSLLVFPSITFLPVASDISKLGEGPKIAILIFAALALGVLFNAMSTPMYRVLEGYLGLPKWLFDRARDRKIQRRKELVERVQEATGLERGKLLERLQRFPVSDDRVVATRLGNAMRGLETIGSSMFKLDTQALWTELRSAVSPALIDDLDNARANVDVFISLFYLSVCFAAISLAVVLSTLHRDGIPRLSLSITCGASLVLLPFWYWLAVISTRGLRSAVQAMVYVGRMRLASQLGLKIPDTIEKERDMWLLVSQLALYTYDMDLVESVAVQLDSYRIQSRPYTRVFRLRPMAGK
jgi:hypothetical protein